MFLLRLLNSAVDALFRILEGIARFLQEVAPPLAKIVFGISPFVLAILASYLRVGLIPAAVTMAIVIIFMTIGLTSALRNKLTGSMLSVEVIISVILLDLLLIAFMTGPLWFNQFFDTGAAVNTEKGKKDVQQPTGKEAVFLSLLDEAISHDNPYEMRQALEELKSMQSKAAVPAIVRGLRKYYPIRIKLRPRRRATDNSTGPSSAY